MKKNCTRLALACLSIAAIAAPVVFAQQQTNTPDQYQGVSQPPADDSIVASPEPATVTAQPATPAKPSPAIPAAPTVAAPVIAPRSPSPIVAAGDDRYDNTDYGIVTAPVQTNSAAPSVALHTRENDDPDADIVTRVPGPANELPAATNICVRISDNLSTDQTAVGAPFHGVVMTDVKRDGSVIIPAGSALRGRVVQVSQGHHVGPAATLRLRPDVVILPDGTAYHLYAQVMNSLASNTRTDSEGGIQPGSHIVKKTAEYGVGVGTGVLVGAELAGPPGALAGSLVGAGLVTTHLLLQHPEAAVIPAGSEIVFSLTEPLDMTPTRN
jgi:hypothetical protein